MLPPGTRPAYPAGKKGRGLRQAPPPSCGMRVGGAGLPSGEGLLPEWTAMAVGEERGAIVCPADEFWGPQAQSGRQCGRGCGCAACHRLPRGGPGPQCDGGVRGGDLGRGPGGGCWGTRVQLTSR